MNHHDLEEPMREVIEPVKKEINKVIIGKEDVIEKILMALIADGHVLLDDVPGVGKTTLALCISRVLGLDYRRVQFTPDVLPSDIVGFSIYDKNSGTLQYMKGIVNDANLLLGDEINRTSSKTQSALLEAMEERQVTVDGVSHILKKPFCVIATQNQVGSAGTQKLPQAEMDRFLVQLTMGYPDLPSEMVMLRDRQGINPMDDLKQLADAETVLQWQNEAAAVLVKDTVLSYIAQLAAATRLNPMLQLGISPRGSLAVTRMAKACAWIRGRDYVTADDVQEIFISTCAHRVILSPTGKTQNRTAETIMRDTLKVIKLPGREKQ